MGIDFDPEKVERLAACHVNTGVVVLASDYDQLLEAYREMERSRDAYADALQYPED